MKETLEEVANKYESMYGLDAVGTEAIDFMEGAKWQQKQLEQELQYFRDKEKTEEQRNREIINSLYNENEILEIIKKALLHKDNETVGNLITAQGEIREANLRHFFEQFKNK